MSDLTFGGMVGDAKTVVDGVSPSAAAEAIAQDSNTLVIDVRDAADIAKTGIVEGGVAVSLGTLVLRGDVTLPEEYRHPELGDKDRPILVTCLMDPMASLGAKQLKEMGYNNVRYIEGGTTAWKEAGLPVDPFPEA